MLIPILAYEGSSRIITGILLIIASCLGEETTPPSPLHRGAARQMYGSGSLRPPGTKPIYATGQRQHGMRTTISPTYTHRRRPLDPYPRVPFPISAREFDSGYPILFDPILEGFPPELRSERPSFRGGMYGGRPEYYNGKPLHSIPKSMYPAGYGLMLGKGYDQPIDLLKTKFPTHNGYIVKSGEGEGEHIGIEEGFEHPCGEGCRQGEYLCVTSCTCIQSEDRCDGQVDCEGDEDELECGEIGLSSKKCDESPHHVRCPMSGKCISKDFLCDGDDDCGDYSDETHCGPRIDCNEDQFECANGLCIPNTWLCDNDNDCKDFSDELNCSRTGCTEDEFECGDGSCISLTWKCDKEMDCSDESDETECDIMPPYCNDEEFRCSNQKCIKLIFKCDGDNDCGDWSDETECEVKPGNCVPGEFKCKSGKCIPERYICDKQQDCEDNDDEAKCDETAPRPCSPDEHACDNGACILKTWVCDGFEDCSHGEDESSCEIVCDESKFPCNALTSNKTVFCINKKHVCDGQKDCPNGEDERNCPKKVPCEKNTKCSQLCVETYDGRHECTCSAGYKLAADGISCEDINECLYATDPVCSQTCNNTIGSFTCGCMTGYILRPDLRTCKALGAPPTLLFANRKDIRQVSLSNAKYTAILKGLQNAIALDYHYSKGLIFWSDVSMDVIRRAYINGTGVTDIIKSGLESPGGVALDWVHDLIFWTDSGTRRIEVASLDGQQRAILAANDLDKPRAIAIHPGEATVFWTDWGPNPKIEKAEMDGSNRQSIVNESVFWPNGLTLDYTTSRIYWADAKHNVIETALFDGSERKKVISKGLPHPFAITIFEDAIYWTDWHTKSISTASKTTGAGLRTIHSHLHFPMDIHSYHPQRQPKYRNHCEKNNGGCEHMCIPNKKSYTCVCRLGQKLKPDGKTCQHPEKLLLFARKKDLRIKHLDSNPVHEHDMVIPVEGIKSAVAIAWDSREDTIFWTDVEKDTINTAYWNGTGQKSLVHSNLVSPAGLALDWLTNKLYWTDSGNSRIEVSNSDGSMRTLLIWENLDKPRDIVVDPLSGYMYWSDWGEKPKIERAAMDGTQRRVVLNSNLTWPNGLAIDHEAKKLYWADAGTKAIEYSNFDGSDRQLILVGNDKNHPFGLDVYGPYIYWTDWQTKRIERIDKITGANRTIVSSNISDLMDVRVFHGDRQDIKTPCSVNNGGCSHLCLLKPQEHSCACPTGIKLQEDGKTCANGPKNFLILAHRIDIRQISLDVPYIADVVLPFTQLKMATSVDVDRKTGEIYWTDTAEDVILKNTPDGKKLKILVMHELQAPDGIAIDSTGRKMYWTDGSRSSIEVAELDGANRKVLFSTNLDNPRAIALHYHHGLLFWTDWGDKAKIEVAHMDGTNRRAIVTKKLKWPNGLAIDRPAERLYWNDGKLNTIESSDLHGRDRKVIVSGVSYPYGLVVVGNHMYWTDWQTQALHRADKTDGSDKTIIRGKLEGLMDVKSVQSANIAENACGKNNGGCSHLCLRNPSGFMCACPTGIRMMKGDKRNCEPHPLAYLLVATRFALTRISFDVDEYWEVTLPFETAHNIIGVDFHWKKKLIFVTDIARNVIQSINMRNLSDIRTIVQKDLASPDGIAIDWIADNLYWTNTGHVLIEMSRLDGSSRKAVITEDLDDPRSIAVFPRKGYLFWSDWGQPRIERSYLDGTSRKVLIGELLSFPIGLVVDYDARRLYWIDAKLNAERVETSDIHGRNRVFLESIQNTHPFSLAIYGDHIYWTDWVKKSVLRAHKKSGREGQVVRPNLEAAMGITMISAERQKGWNPCAINNGGCSHLCLFKQKNYTCACPTEKGSCTEEMKVVVPLECPGEPYDCTLDDEVDTEDLYYHPHLITEYGEPTQHEPSHSNTFYLITMVPMLCIVVFCVVLIAFLLIKKGKDKYFYATGRSFSNPNYYSSGNEPAGPQNPVDRKQFIWKRLKYDKSQERVYEETAGTNSPEIASLIPTILTPCSSNCEPVTPELERSPSVTPLHKLDTIKPVA